MSTVQTPVQSAPVKPAEFGSDLGKLEEGKREKRTIAEIRESKRIGEKMVYMSVPDYTLPRNGLKWPASTWRCSGWRLVAHGHRSTVPAIR